MNLSGKAAIVTASGSEIGEAVALRYAKNGAAVTVAVFLCSNEASFMTGAGVPIDSGHMAIVIRDSFLELKN